MLEDMFIVKVVEMYYKQGMSQIEIGKKLKVSGTKISRTLEKARENGYVQIKINYPDGYGPKYELNLEKKFQLKEAMVVGDKDKNLLEKKITHVAADFILRIITNNMTIALGRGISLRRVVEYLENDVRLKFLKIDNSKIVPLVGNTNLSVGSSKEERLAYSNFLVEEMARILNTDSYQILTPQFASTREMRSCFLNEPSVKKVMDIVRAADVAVMGVGTVSMNAMPGETNVFSKETFDDICARGGIGDLFAHIYDSEGHIVESEIEDKLIGVSLEELKKIPIRVGIACGKEKKEAVLGALRGGYINVLITDEDIAKYLIKA